MRPRTKATLLAAGIAVTLAYPAYGFYQFVNGSWPHLLGPPADSLQYWESNFIAIAVAAYMVTCGVSALVASRRRQYVMLLLSCFLVWPIAVAYLVSEIRWSARALTDREVNVLRARTGVDLPGDLSFYAAAKHLGVEPKRMEEILETSVAQP